MKLLIVRHGETRENVKGIAQGHEHGTLTKRGKEQARLLAEGLRKYRIDVIYSSDLGRAANTAKIIAKQHREAEMHLTKDLRERNYGIHNKSPREVVFRAREESGVDYHKWKPPKGESYEDVQKRIRRFLNRIKKHTGTVLVVAHGGVNKVIISTVMKRPLRNAYRMAQANTCVNMINMGNGKPRIRLLNNTRHLEVK